mmetsp:Transcript_18188/g.41163  ORF Transcript_18188/g.41163 Transcript_18188/m.41163 type:complete len:166 (-) Transcript_18188:73-570(-)
MAFSSTARRSAVAVASSAARTAPMRAPPAPFAGGLVGRPAGSRVPQFCAGYQARAFSAQVPAAEHADKLIKEKPCVVFSKSTCPFCAMAKSILEKTGAKHDVFEMDRELSWQEVDKLQQHLQKLTGARSVPRVFIGGKCIGGGDDTAELHESGELKKLLEQAGAL